MVALVQILLPLITGIISFFPGALFLMIGTKIFKTENNNYKTALKTMFFPTLISLFFVIMISNFVTNKTLIILLWALSVLAILFLSVWLTKRNYKVGIGKAILIILVSFAIGIIPMVLLGLLLGFIEMIIILKIAFG